MATVPVSCRLQVEPAERFQLVPLAEHLPPEVAGSPKLLLASLHTTAGLLAPDVARHHGHDAAAVRQWLHPVSRLFPPHADYRHDALHLREELTPEQRAVEPKNADAHLTFIGAGLQGCVTLDDPTATPPWLVELDGVSEHERRKRQVLAVGFTREVVVARERVRVPVRSRTVDAMDLRDESLGTWRVIERLLERHEVENGRIDIALEGREKHAGLTMNEHETLLMRHDLARVLRDPVHFALERGRDLARDPSAFARRGLDHARYDAVKILGRFEAAFGRGGSLAMRVVEAVVGPAASRFLRVGRSISLPACRELSGSSSLPIVQGRYQSPLLLQWRAPRESERHLVVTLSRFE